MQYKVFCNVNPGVFDPLSFIRPLEITNLNQEAEEKKVAKIVLFPTPDTFRYLWNLV